MVALVPIIPRALALRSPEELSREIEERVRGLGLGLIGREAR